jgi:hypothetical protein
MGLRITKEYLFVKPLVEFQLNQEHHNDFGDHQNNEEIDRRRKVNCKQNNEKDTTKHEAGHKNCTNPENELFGLADS